MILAFSTSSPLVSVAILSPEGERIADAEQWAPRAASSATVRALDAMLAKTGLSAKDFSGVLADLGPGSFTGVRVGVALVKALGYAWKLKVSGAPAYRLIGESGTVVLPSKKGEVFVFRPGCEPELRRDLPDEPFRGYGHGVAEPEYPHASRFAGLLDEVEWTSPEQIVPLYIHAPSISVPKNPYGSHVRAHGG